MRRPRASDLPCVFAVLLLTLACVFPSLDGPPLPATNTLARPQQPVAARPLDEAALARLSWPSAAPTLEPLAPASREQLCARIEALLAREGVPGVGIAVREADGTRWSAGLGHADLAARQPMSPAHMFRAASITKTVIALALMRLVERGQLKLDARLSEIMPDVEIRNAWEHSHPLSLAHALEHSAGFDDMRFNEFYGTDDTTPAQALALNPRSRVVRWQPGSRMSYSNPGYTIAAYALEQATGEPWERVVQREVLDPLAMQSASFRRTPQIAARMSQGYDGPERVVPYRAIAHRPAGALLATPGDILRLAELGLGRGTLDGEPFLSPRSFARIERTETLDYAPTDAAYGLGNYGQLLHAAARGRGHDGGLPGFLSHHSYYPELGVGYVMLLNSTHSQRAYVEIRELLFAYATRGQARPGGPPIVADPETVAGARSWYDSANPRMELSAFIDRALLGAALQPSEQGGGHEPQGLLMTITAPGVRNRVPLLPTGRGGFRHPRQGGTSVRVTRDAHARPVLVVGGMGYFEAGSARAAQARRVAVVGAVETVQVMPLWCAGALLVLLYGVARGREIDWAMVRNNAWPASAALLGCTLAPLLQAIFAHDAFTDLNWMTLALCLDTIAFALLSAAGLVVTIRALSSGERMLFGPTAAAFACFGLSAWLGWNGMIGLRLWAW